MKQLVAILSLLAVVGCAPSPVASSPTTPSRTTPSTTATASPSASSLPPDERPAFTFSAIQRLNAKVGFVAGWTGTGLGLRKTTDGGATWRDIALPGSGHVTALRFIDENVGWVAGFFIRDVQFGCAQAAPPGATPCRGVVLRTTDGGATWRVVLEVDTNGAAGEPIQALQAVDGTRAWVVVRTAACDAACPGVLRRTTDGGATWTTVFSGPIAAIRFASAVRGWIATFPTADAIEVRTTSDGGASWSTPFAAPGNSGYVGLDAASTSVAWLLTRDGAFCSSSNCQRYTLWRTADATTWQSLGNPKGDDACFYGHLAAPLFASPSRGWMGLNLGAGGAEGVGGILSTNDGGRSWSCATTPPNVALVSAADPDHLWITTTRAIPETLRASDDGGATWRELAIR